jgi:hypothetical protein
VRPAARVAREDLVAFAASAEVALTLGWRYVVVTGWKPHVTTTLDSLSAQRRPLTDRLGMVDQLLAGVAAGADSRSDTDYPDRRQSPECVIPGHRPITRAKERASE